MIKDAVLSSEQALDEYFTALLGEESLLDSAEAEPEAALESVDSFPEVESVVEPTEVAISAEDLIPDVSHAGPLEQNDLEPALAPQPSMPEPSVPDTAYSEFEVPDLEDVQRLLSQLETSSFADAPEIDELIEQNTLDIATAVEVEPKVELVEPKVEEAIEEPVVVVEEELQEWDVSALAQPEPEVDVPVEEIIPEPVQDVSIDSESVVEQQVETELETQAGENNTQEWHNVARNEAFQVLYFDVNSVTFAVPLDELGGIHRKADEINHLIGRPDWYLGLQTNKSDQLDVVDTARWVMAEKLKDNEHRKNYQYIVMLGDSMWGLASNQLMGTEWLNPEKVRWRESAGKRPWLAGMVKEKMCALIHVDAMVNMLNAGLDVKALDS
ncbi:chemotaxis protein CheW [Vibrio sp. SCSIO 43136]|uniref:chemotaxis protein CheW n=1 Tax=Vibrio sp. SCSIO 43136 TaxID=2819101 RepID=UPI002075761E|nr:chemotaxis protein CheW [Vibrio sp. SCSIO 43136]USD65996.1 chemotaxis protein CheW [Vibrio sp. SCSIO 43136]